MIPTRRPHQDSIAAEMAAVRASLREAVELLEHNLDLGTDLAGVTAAAAMVIEQVTRLKALLVLVEQAERDGTLIKDTPAA